MGEEVIFTTPEFVVFALIFFWMWTIVPRRARKMVLLTASYLFYGSWNAKFLLLIIGSTLLDFYIGGALAKTEDARRRKRLVTASVVANLGALGVFKYFNFFVDSAIVGLAAIGVEASAPALDVILPVGISFYTFQTMSYTIDVYRRRMDPTRSFIDFALYVAFFPQLVAGPIERATHLLPQIRALGEKTKIVDWSGVGLIALGAFKKVVIADNIAVLVEMTYHQPTDVYAPALWLGTYAFAIQIYCDFSGYSDIAVGLGRLMGLDIVQNFKAPYAAAGPAEFWRRWHISLSTWLRDYLYIPLGGNRGGWFRTRRNLMLTMLLGGLWHGAAWNFVLWGLFHGTLLIVFRAEWLLALGERLAGFGRAAKIVVISVRRLVFFHITCLGWALFRAESLEDSGTIFSALLNVTKWDVSGWLAQVELSGEGNYLAFWAMIMAGLVLAQNLWSVGSDRVVQVLFKAPAPVWITIYVGLFYACLLLAPEKPPPFLYFQF